MISTLSAHNLAAHEIGGYQVLFSSGYFCRRRHILFNNRNLSFLSSSTAWRTSIIERLERFHPTTSLPPDCVHDFLEGCSPLVLMALLKDASSSRLMTYGEKIDCYSLLCDDFFFSSLAEIQERTETFE